MDSKLNQALFSGILATALMTMVMYLFSLLGLPEVHPPAMLSDIMSVSIVLSWMLHFFIGVVYALFYMFVFKNVVEKIKSKYYKGILFGVTLFIVAQIAITVMGAVFNDVSVKCDFTSGEPHIAEHAAAMLKDGCKVIERGGTIATILTLLFSLIGHLCYGVAVVITVRKPKEE